MNNINNETGRSMIEMLGVLAIIGVLSVGGIAGYSKAMMQYKINKTADQITQIVGNVRTLFGSQKNYAALGGGASDDINLWKKSHIFPDEMWNTAGTNIENPFGGTVALKYGARKTDGDYKAFNIYMGSLPEEACMALATYDWGSGSSSGLIAIGIRDGSAGSFGYLSGCTGSSSDGKAIACAGGSTVSIPIPVNIAANACQTGDNNYIVLKFY